MIERVGSGASAMIRAKGLEVEMRARISRFWELIMLGTMGFTTNLYNPFKDSNVKEGL